ncbi:MAG: cobyric acid synthase [Campylobacterota bacterium]|nr:cobyric acid synthase [Campylobacterota bacterium]MEA3499214.1 cobyric acid synthase [Campylobacterota bacterium]
MKKQKNISILGTSSDAGKSTVTFLIGKLLQNTGYNVAPFKAQNVSNNSYVANDGSEIAIAQHFQAEVMELKTSYLNNPILLKTGKKNSSQIIVKGKAVKDVNVREYFRDIDTLKPVVKKCFEKLNKQNDIVVAEGAGSPVELNLMSKDLSNIFIADKFDTKIILVADIERSGVFASIWGTYNLLPKKLRKNVIGVIVNKFRGDMSLFENGVKIIEKDFGIPVIGVLPYKPLNLGFEDSQSILNYRQNKQNPKLKVAVIQYPTMSNYNDFEPLLADQEIYLEFVNSNKNLEQYDLVILSGSKATIEDLKWLKKTGLFKQIKNRTKPVYGVCGGYQMMFNNIIDNNKVEVESDTKIDALGIFNDDIKFKKKKILKKSIFNIFDLEVEGFEMHCGISKKYPFFAKNKNFQGSFIHAIFDNDNFRDYLFKSIDKRYKGFKYKKYKKDTIQKFTKSMEKHIDINKVLKGIKK